MTTPREIAEPKPHEWGSAREFYGPRHEYRESLVLRKLLPTLPGRQVLNAGCGAGSLTLRLLDEGLEVTSVDASAEFIEHVSGLLARRSDAARSPTELGDLENLHYDDEAFDGIVCGEVLEHLEDDWAAVRHFARVLRPGGVVVVSVPANPWRYDWLDHWAGHQRRYTPEALAERFLAAGFSDVSATPWGFPLTGVFHRNVFMPILRRRISAGAVGGPPSPLQKRLFPVVRAALEFDTLFMGRRAGYFGLILWARKGPSNGGRGGGAT